MRKFFLLICLIPQLLYAQQENTQLKKKVQQAISGFQGDIGIYIKNLRTGKEVAINADTVFPTASVVKVPLLLGIMNRIEKKEISYDSSIVYRYKDSVYYPGEDVMGQFKDSSEIRVSKAILLMLSLSDNTASLWLQKLAGTGTRINTVLDSLGYKNTRVNSRTPGREAYRSQYGWGQTTPREIAKIFEDIYRRKVFSLAACDRMLRCLGRNYWDVNGAVSQIPPEIAVFSKSGTIDQTRNEILLVNKPGNPFILSIFTKNNKDTSWAFNNEAWTLARQLAKMLLL